MGFQDLRALNYVIKTVTISPTRGLQTVDLNCETDRAEGDLEANNGEFDQYLKYYLNFFFESRYFQSHKSLDVFLHHYI